MLPSVAFTHSTVMIVLQHLHIFAILLAGFICCIQANETDCVTPLQRPGHCIFDDDCAPLKKIKEDKSKSHNETILFVKSVCQQIKVRLKVCCDADESHLCPPIKEPTIVFDCYSRGDKIECDKFMTNGIVIYPSCKEFHEYSQNRALRPFSCADGSWDAAIPLCIPSGPLLCQKGWNCNIFLHVGAYRFPANKGKVAAQSAYLLNLFKRGETEVTIPETANVDPTVVAVVLEYIHENNLDNWKFKQCPDIILLSRVLKIPQFETNCVNLLKSQLNDKNYQQLLIVSRDMKSLESLGYIEKFIGANFKKLISGSEWLMLDENLLGRVLQSDDLHIDTEEQAFEGLYNWALHNWSDRKLQYQNLLQHIRMKLLSKEFITNRVTQTCDDDMAQCLRLILTAIRWHDSPKSTKQSSPPNPRINTIEQFILIVGGRNTKTAGKIELYNVRDDSWSTYADTGLKTTTFPAVVLNGNLMMFGGLKSTKSTNEVWSMDLSTKTLIALAAMQQVRFSAAAVAIEGYVYVSGGWNDSRIALDTVERYDPVTNIWTTVTQMPQARFDHAAATWKGDMYLIGGATNDPEGSLSTVDIYNPVTNQWSSIEKMKFSRSSCAAVFLDDEIFVIGGSTELRSFSRLTSVLRYDLRNEKWTTGTDMPKPIDGTKAVVIYDKIIITGGAGNENSTYEYNPVTDKWRQLGSFNNQRHRHNALLVPKSLIT